MFEKSNEIEEEKKQDSRPVRASFASSGASHTTRGSLLHKLKTGKIQINAKDIVLHPFCFTLEEDSSYMAAVSKIHDPLRKTKL